MSHLTSLQFIFLLCALGFLTLLFGPSTVMIRFVHYEFPGGSLALARNTPISLKPGTGSQYFFK